LLQRKKILSLLIKLLIGIGSFMVIYLRLKSDFTSDKLSLLYQSATSVAGFLSFGLCLLLIPINWGIESYKWKLITAPIEKIDFITATKSVYSGVCLGNLAPGRATEFVAKIIFFKVDNRPKITVVHFINGMFQLSITIITGLIALIFKLASFGSDYLWLAYLASGLGILVLILFGICLFKMNAVMNFVSNKISKQNNVKDFKYEFTGLMLLKLFGFSALRYAVFFFQMLLLIYLFYQQPFDYLLLLSVATYFLITTIIPMISLLEGAIRAAVALVVFKDCGISNSVLALSSVLIWFINIIIPSVFGYIILLRQNFDFKLYSSKK
jgi:hypothetical protein